jgi:hypothetical protein
MANNDLGVPIEDFINSVVTSYKKGFEDAVEQLTLVKESMDIEKMKETFREDLKKNGRIKAEW